MSTFRVPKRRTDVEIEFFGGTVRKMAMFLGDHASAHNGPERISDLVDGPDPFIPAQDADSEAIRFLSRDSIAVVRVAQAIEHTDQDDLSDMTQHSVAVHLVTGTTLTGLIRYVRPPDNSRLIDYLNGSEFFIRIFEEGRASLIHKRHIVHVDLIRK